MVQLSKMWYSLEHGAVKLQKVCLNGVSHRILSEKDFSDDADCEKDLQTLVWKSEPIQNYFLNGSTTEISSLEIYHLLREKAIVTYEGQLPSCTRLLGLIKDEANDAFFRKHQASMKDRNVTEQWKLQRQHLHETTQITKRLVVQTNSTFYPLRCEQYGASVPKVMQAMYESARAPVDDDVAQYLYVPYVELLAHNGAYQYQMETGIPLRKFMPHNRNSWILRPFYSVFTPVRTEYVKIMQNISDGVDHLESAMDVGTGSGILTAVLLREYKRHIKKVIGTDINPAAVRCAAENMRSFRLTDQTEFFHTEDLFPRPDQFSPVDLILCNPPWIPEPGNAKLSLLDRAMFDTDNFLQRFLRGAREHLRNKDSEVWLIVSDLPEHLGLRTREELLQYMADGGLYITDHRTKEAENLKQRHKGPTKLEELFPLVTDARAKEKTHLYRLRQTS